MLGIVNICEYTIYHQLISSFTHSFFFFSSISNNMYAQAHSDTVSHFPSPSPATHHLTEFDTLSQLNYNYNYNYNNNNNNSCSSGYSSYGGSPTSVPSPSSLMQLQRSVSSHSLHHSNNNATNHTFSPLFAHLLDSHNTPVRRASSTGDLHRINGMQHNHYSDSPLSSESSMIIEGMSRTCRYSPEEKKVRIERYRTKRNQRNFNKKIKYACRKTLADSRPRIRGRFARNDEMDKNSGVQWSQIGVGEEEDEEFENWVSILDSLAAANFAQESQGSSSSFGLFY